MALISCPECDKKISDTAKSCPYCGYIIKESSTNEPKRTPLAGGPSRALGVFWILGGIILFIGGFLFFPFGIVGIIGGFAMIIFGCQRLVGFQKGICPYCGNAVLVYKKDLTCKCPHCRKISTQKGNYLEAIN